MKLSFYPVKEKEVSLRKLKNLAEDVDHLRVQGVYYTNSLFSRRYLARAHDPIESLDVKGNRVTAKISARVGAAGLLESESTLDMLVKHEAGDLPGFTPEGLLEGSGIIEGNPPVAEPISFTRSLYNIDFFLILDAPRVTVQEFKIAGVPFTLVNLYHSLEADFEQTVTILYGPKDSFYFLSNFTDKELDNRSTKMILDLITDENITGKPVLSASLAIGETVSSAVNPSEEMLDSYTTSTGGIAIGSVAGYVALKSDLLDKMSMRVTGKYDGLFAKGAFILDISSGKTRISVYMA